MALDISKEINNSGVTVEYWKITEVGQYVESEECRILIKAYKDAASRQAGKDPVYARMIILSGDQNPLPNATTNPIAASYVAIKQYDAYFAGAQDA